MFTSAASVSRLRGGRCLRPPKNGRTFKKLDVPRPRPDVLSRTLFGRCDASDGTSDSPTNMTMESLLKTRLDWDGHSGRELRPLRALETDIFSRFMIFFCKNILKFFFLLKITINITKYRY